MALPKTGVTVTDAAFVIITETNEPAKLTGNFTNVPTTIASSFGATPQRRIGVDPNILGGEPYVQGTRIPISAILDGLAEGLTPEQLIEHFPRLTLMDIQAVLEYAGSLALA